MRLGRAHRHRCPLDYLHGMTANNDWQPGANLTLALAGHWRLNGQVLAVERPHRLSYASHGAFFMSASRCAVRLVVPVVVMAPFSWFLVADASADGRDGRDAAVLPVSAVGCRLRSGQRRGWRRPARGGGRESRNLHEGISRRWARGCLPAATRR